MEVSLDIIKNSVFIKIFNFFFTVVVILGFVVLGIQLFFDSEFKIEPIYAVIILTPFAISCIPLFFKNLKYKLCGQILFSNNSIKIDDSIYEIERIENIKIALYGYDGQLSFINSPYSPFKFMKDGGGNNISFKYDNRMLYFNFFINYKYENDELTIIIERWKEQFPEKVKFLKY